MLLDDHFNKLYVNIETKVIKRIAVQENKTEFKWNVAPPKS